VHLQLLYGTVPKARLCKIKYNFIGYACIFSKLRLLQGSWWWCYSTAFLIWVHGGTPLRTEVVEMLYIVENQS